PHHGIGSDPERRTVVRKSLVNLVLHVRRRAGDSLKDAGRAGKRTVRRLNHGNASMLRLAQMLCEANRVLGMQAAVSIEDQYVLAVGSRATAWGWRCRPEHEPALPTVLLEAAAHEAQVAVEIHRLVRLVREVGVTLSFERCQCHVESAR